MVEEEQRGRDDAREAASKAERRVGEINAELEELRGQLEQVCVQQSSLITELLNLQIHVNLCRLSHISIFVCNL